MALAITITSVTGRQGVAEVSGKITASGNYTTGGDTLDFTKATQDAKFSGISAFIPSSQPPTQLSVWSANGQITNQYAPIIGSAQNNSKLFVGGATFGTQLAAGAYPVAVTGDVIEFYSEFPLFQ